jgi:ATP-dependent Clp protease ATP-binding subunit ClpA
MFERYTENARRVIFFARYEASQFGSPYIESEHLLLGILREDKALTNRFLRSHAAVESIRRQIESATVIREKVSTSVDLPLTNECKRILDCSAEEAERLEHKHIGPEHLLLGILREEKSFASQLLRDLGLKLNQVRLDIAATVEEDASGKSETGRVGALARAIASPQIHVVDAASSDLLLTYTGRLPRIPAIGEALLIHEAGGAFQSYRVRDVVWIFEQENVSSLGVVQVRVAKVDTGEGTAEASGNDI